MPGRKLTADPLLPLIHHALSLTPDVKQSTSMATYISEAPYYVRLRSINRHLKSTSPSPLQASPHSA